MIFQSKRCSLSNTARLYEELLIKWIHPAGEAKGRVKKGWKEQKGHFQTTEGFCLYCFQDPGLRLFRNKKSRADCWDFSIEHRANVQFVRRVWLEEFGFSHHQIFKIPEHWVVSGEKVVIYPWFSSQRQMFLKEKEGLGQRMWHLNPPTGALILGTQQFSLCATF